MIARKSLALLLALVMALSTFGLAAADGHITACEGEEIIGSVTSIDEETGQMIITTETGECYVTLDQEYEHPIVQLFNDYFGTTDSDSLSDAVAGLDGWGSYDEDTLTWDWTADETEGASATTVTGLVDNGDGTYTLELSVEGELDPVYVLLTDPEEIAYYQALLDATSVEFSLTQDEEGNSFISDVGDEVQAYHEDGMGFGVLTKFYSLAADSDLTVDELVSAFKDEKTGLGLLFHEHGYPTMMGVGHIKQAQKEDDTTTLTSEETSSRGKPEDKGKPEGKGKPEDKGNKGKSGKGGD